MTDCIVRSRIDPYVKAKAVRVFERMGLTLSEAIRVFLYQSVANKCIPFSINMPNTTTRGTLEAIKRGEDLEKTNLSQLKKDWDDACEK